MIVDNFDQIRKHLVFDKDGDYFYFLQIIQRSKDFGADDNQRKSSKIIRSFYVTSLEYFDSHADQIKSLCENYNARAYIHLNPRSWRKCVLKSFGVLADFIRDNQCHLMKTIVEKTAGDQIADGVKKTWIVDIDSKDENIVAGIEADVNVCEPDGDKIIDKIPTKSGFHLITSPFNIQKFRTMHKEGEIDVHKNNPTLLYFNFTL